MSEDRKRKPRTEEHRRKIIESMKRVGVGKWNKGRKRSEYSKIKTSETAKRNGVGKWMKGKKLSKSWRENISNARKLIKHTKESKLKIKLSTSKEKHYNWQGGKSFEIYSLDWTRSLRISIRERDHYTCQICGEKQEERAFSIHHIDYDKKNCNPNNLITLCCSCHTKTNYNREYWIKYFINKL